ncbi:glycogen synthase [Thiocystis violascens]|uniref:Glycogen synthase n=1 Tax=Thiocystis violascens (strain ATCC 17096 / DSM 198 / 6111) TaxID=765911 RepID=I3YH15_THIV6|nr:glycogen synthase [Thiocystis violascens]AFL76283.1 glycogen/starch synthase, ADP-glucose type [Thiocystis violascens DSM 198]
MQIAMVSAECAPIAKAGGLGDFVQGLSRALVGRGATVDVFLPYYDVSRLDSVTGLREVYRELRVPFHDQWLTCRVLGGAMEGVNCLFIDPRSPHGFFQRGRIYGESDDPERFAFFARAVLEFLLQSGRRPDILHCNDWQTGLIPVLLYEIYQALGLTSTRVCYTLHNLGYQGQVGESILRQVGLDPRRLMAPDRLLDPQDTRVANLLKGGIVFSNFVNTVSPRYAWEIQETDQGMGLQSLLKTHTHKFGGVLNGIDPSIWSPEVDPLIPVNFGSDSLPSKAANRQALRARLGLRDAEKPILAIVSRLDRQKGVHLMEHGIRYALAHDSQVVLLGTALDPVIAERFARLKHETEPNPDCHLELGYDEALAHLIYAGADLILIPSLYEPCGLTQMIAMKYGVVPVVRRVGGLADTVFDANYSDKPFEVRNGYLFDDLTEAGLESALSRAIGLWRGFPEYFRQLRVNGMRADFSWSLPGQQYLDIYAQIRA